MIEKPRYYSTCLVTRDNSAELQTKVTTAVAEFCICANQPMRKFLKVADTQAPGDQLATGQQECDLTS